MSGRPRPSTQEVILQAPPSLIEAVAAAARPYVFEHAACFAAELAGFAASGLSLPAYDARVFGQTVPTMAPANGSSTMNCTSLPLRA